MARRAEGYAIYRDARTGNWIVRFSHAGRRHTISTRTGDPRKAKAEAARIYSETLSGKRSREQRRVASDPLDVLLADWVAAMQDELPATAPIFEMYAFTHWSPFFHDTNGMTESTVADYMRARLRKVTAKTVRKELSALRRFFAWAKEREHFDPPAVCEVPGSAIGTRAVEQRRVDLDEVTIERVLAALPERTYLTKSKRRGGLPVRAFYTVMWETGLRRGTLWRLEAPRHYRRGSRELFVAREIDKARYERTIDLTPRARVALDSVCPDEGLIFGKHDMRKHLRAAAIAVGLDAEDAKHLSNHDFRHARTTHLIERGGSLLGVGYVVGHLNASTTDLYAHARRHAGRAVLGLDTGDRLATEPREEPDTENEEGPQPK